MKKILFLALFILVITAWYFVNEKNKQDLIIADNARKEHNSELLNEQIEEFNKRQNDTLRNDNSLQSVISFYLLCKNSNNIIVSKAQSILFESYTNVIKRIDTTIFSKQINKNFVDLTNNSKAKLIIQNTQDSTSLIAFFNSGFQEKSFINEFSLFLKDKESVNCIIENINKPPFLKIDSNIWAINFNDTFELRVEYHPFESYNIFNYSISYIENDK